MICLLQARAQKETRAVLLEHHAIEGGSLGVSDLDEPRPDASLRLPKKSGKLILSDMVGDVGDLQRSSRHPHSSSGPEADACLQVP